MVKKMRYSKRKYPDRKRLALAKRKATKYFRKYGAFEAYNALSTDLPARELTTGGNIDYEKIFDIFVDSYYQNPEPPV